MSGTIAVIGTAGRREDAARITPQLYDAMFAETEAAIREWAVAEAVSGGAAVSDHLAVRAYLEGVVSGLRLFLPARFERGAFVPNPRIRFNPGQTSNGYHRAFSEACGIDSLGEIEQAIRKGAEVEVHEGFHLRNSEVADACSHLLAFTFGNGSGAGDVRDDFLPEDEGFSAAATAGLRDGGTAHTWGQAWKPIRKRHVYLGALERALKAEQPSEISAHKLDGVAF